MFVQSRNCFAKVNIYGECHKNSEEEPKVYGCVWSHGSYKKYTACLQAVSQNVEKIHMQVVTTNYFSITF